MKRRVWDSKSKTKIVLEGLQGRSVVYTTKTLLIWIVQHFGVEKLINIKAL